MANSLARVAFLLQGGEGSVNSDFMPLTQRFTPTRKFYRLRDGRISAVHFGDTSAPIRLVMLNANGFNGYSYKTILEPLGVHAVALDTRGHGMSQLPTDVAALKNWHIFRDDVVEFFERYIDSPVVLAGHSYGAVTGTLAMPQIKDKVSGYVGFDPVLIPWFGRFADLAMKLCVII